METQDKVMFRIGGIYRNKQGHVVSLVPAKEPEGDFVALSMKRGGNPSGESHHRLSDGVNECHDDYPEFDLLPGEVDDQGNRIEEKIEESDLRELVKHFIAREQAKSDPNAAMIARDGQAKPAVIAVPAAPIPTALPPIEGLTRLGAVDHRLGSAFR